MPTKRLITFSLSVVLLAAPPSRTSGSPIGAVSFHGHIRSSGNIFRHRSTNFRLRGVGSLPCSSP